MKMAEAERRTDFEKYVSENGRLINKICYMYASCMDDFNDLRQEVLLNIWQGMDAFEARSKVSTWIYRAIKLYFKRKSLYANNLEVMQNVVSHHGTNSETMIDIILSLLRFNKEHQNLFTYITRLRHSGQNKIHWQKTISRSAAIIQNSKPIYLQPHTKQKEINFRTIYTKSHRRSGKRTFRTFNFKTRRN